jgi:hypothetical protein
MKDAKQIDFAAGRKRLIGVAVEATIGTNA